MRTTAPHFRGRGCACGKNRIARLMRENGIRAKTQRRYKVTTNSQPSYPVVGNLLNQEFIAQRPNQIWVSDITYIPTPEGWLYLATILDLFSRKVVGWSTSSSLSQELAIKALQRAVQARKPRSGLLHHSDRGIQYASLDYHVILNDHGSCASIGGKENGYDSLS
ncbi:MAG: IS3 family transposase [Candidatus Atribacteria bacterium]|nr:IS3 family transposase [Candidatus Atribacteria bacterium]